MKMEYIFLKSLDKYCVSKEAFINFLCMNERIMLRKEEKIERTTLLLDMHELEYALEIVEVKESKEIIFHLRIMGCGEEDEQIVMLEEFDTLIKEINEKQGKLFIINTVWNDVSLNYAKKLYPDIIKVESTLRKIIYLFMLKTVGNRWFDTDTPFQVQENICDVIKKNSKSRSEIVDLLDYADFIKLSSFLSVPYARKSDLNSLFKQLKQYENKKTGKTLTSEVIRKLSEDYEPKSNWERYFSDKLNVKSLNMFSKNWNSLYNIRNCVAHVKTIMKEDYDKAVSLIQSFLKMFDECLNIIDTLNITEEESNDIEEVAQQIISHEMINIDRLEVKPYKLQLKDVMPGILYEDKNIKGYTDALVPLDISDIKCPTIEVKDCAILNTHEFSSKYEKELVTIEQILSKPIFLDAKIETRNREKKNK